MEYIRKICTTFSIPSACVWPYTPNEWMENDDETNKYCIGGRDNC